MKTSHSRNFECSDKLNDEGSQSSFRIISIYSPLVTIIGLIITKKKKREKRYRNAVYDADTEWKQFPFCFYTGSLIWKTFVDRIKLPVKRRPNALVFVISDGREDDAASTTNVDKFRMERVKKEKLELKKKYS